MTATGRRLGLASVALAALVVSACGAGAPSSSVEATATPQPSPTPIGSARPSDLPSLEDCPNFVAVVETGPLPGDDGTEDGPMAREQQRISADVQAAVAYGAGHADEFGSVRFENGPRVRLVIGFTRHIAEHCAALRVLLEYPDEFEIVHQPSTQVELEAAMRTISELAGESLQSVGHGGGVLHVHLRADGEAVAATVLATYGEIAEITVGMLPYPNRFGGPSLCGSEGGDLSDAPLDVEAELDAGVVRTGADFRGEVRITNMAAVPFDYQSGPTQTAAVYLPGADTPVGFYTGGMDALGFGATIAPGASITLDVVGGTASCDPALGWALPPGDYEVRVRVQVQTQHDNAPTEIGYLLTPPVALTIEP